MHLRRLPSGRWQAVQRFIRQRGIHIGGAEGRSASSAAQTRAATVLRRWGR